MSKNLMYLNVINVNRATNCNVRLHQLCYMYRELVVSACNICCFTAPVVNFA